MGSGIRAWLRFICQPRKFFPRFRSEAAKIMQLIVENRFIIQGKEFVNIGNNDHAICENYRPFNTLHAGKYVSGRNNLLYWTFYNPEDRIRCKRESPLCGG